MSLPQPADKRRPFACGGHFPPQEPEGVSEVREEAETAAAEEELDRRRRKKPT